MIHRIEIDPYACCGHGDCVHIAPSVFPLDGDVATVIGDGPAAEGAVFGQANGRGGTVAHVCCDADGRASRDLARVVADCPHRWCQAGSNWTGGAG